jgi:hypothetical protein
MARWLADPTLDGRDARPTPVAPASGSLPTVPAAPVTPGAPWAAPQGRPIPLGEVTRRHLARVLEQQQGALLLACVEMGGGDPQGRWRLTIGDARLEPEG